MVDYTVKITLTMPRKGRTFRAGRAGRDRLFLKSVLLEITNLPYTHQSVQGISSPTDSTLEILLLVLILGRVGRVGRVLSTKYKRRK